MIQFSLFLNDYTPDTSTSLISLQYRILISTTMSSQTLPLQYRILISTTMSSQTLPLTPIYFFPLELIDRLKTSH